MESRLHESHPGNAVLAGSVEQSVHQFPPNAAILNIGIHRDRSDPGDRATLVHAIAACDVPVHFRHDTVETRVGERTRKQADPYFLRWNVRRKSVVAVDLIERVVADLAAGRGVVRCGSADRDHARVAPYIDYQEAGNR